MYRSIKSVSKIAHQMWHDHWFSQWKKTTERAVGVGVGGDRGGGVGKIWKRGGVGNVEGSS